MSKMRYSAAFIVVLLLVSALTLTAVGDSSANFMAITDPSETPSPPAVPPTFTPTPFLVTPTPTPDGGLTAYDYWEMGVDAAEAGDVNLALEYYNQALALNPEYASAYNSRGNVYYDMGQPERAIEDYDRAIEISPRYAYAFNNRGNAYRQLGQYERAIEDFNRSLEYGNAEPYIPLWNRALAYEALEEYELALADYTAAIDANPEPESLYLSRGILNDQLGNQPEAASDYYGWITRTELTRLTEPALEDGTARTLEMAEGRVYELLFTADAGSIVTITASGIPDGSVDPLIVLLNDDRTPIAGDDDDGGGTAGLNSAIQDFVLPYSGRYTVILSHAGGGSEGTIELGFSIESVSKSASEFYSDGNSAFGAEKFADAIGFYTRAIELNNEYAQAYYWRGRSYYESGDPEAALADYNMALELDGDYEAVFISRGLVLDTLGDQDAAVVDYWAWMMSQEIRRQPVPSLEAGDTATLLLRQGDLYYLTVALEAGQSITVKAASDTSDTVDPLLVITDLDETPLVGDDDGGGDLDSFIEAFEVPETGDYYIWVGHAGADKSGTLTLEYTISLAVDPNLSYSDYYNRGNSAFNDENYELAFQEFTRSIILNPDYADAWYWRGRTYSALGDFEAAIDDYSQALSLRDDAGTYNSRGFAYLRLERNTEALEDFSNAIALLPNYALPYLNRGIIHTRLGNQAAAAVDYYEWMNLERNSSLVGNPLEYDVPVQYDITAGLTYVLPLVGELGQTITITAMSIPDGTFDPLIVLLGPDARPLVGDDDSAGGLNSGIYEFELPENGAYTLVVGHAAADKDGTVEILLTRGEGSETALSAQTYYERGLAARSAGNYAEAIEHFDSALLLDPEFVAVWYWRGRTYSSMGDEDQAIADLSKAIELDPEFDRGYLSRGLRYDQQGNQEAAASDYYQWLTLSQPDSTEGTLDDGSTATFTIVSGSHIQIPLEIQAGQHLTVLAEGVPDGDFDPLIVLLAPDGTPLFGDDDDGEGVDGLNSLIEDVALDETGIYTLLVGHAYVDRNGNVQITVTLTEDSAGPGPAPVPLTLDETHTSVMDTLELSLNYPEGWFIEAQGDGFITITNKEGLIEADEFDSGDVGVVVMYMPSTELEVFVEPDATATEAATQLLQSLMNTDNSVTDAEVIPMSINDRGAAKVRTVLQDAFTGNAAADVFMIAIEQPTGFVIVLGIAPEGELMPYDIMLDDIARSIRLTEISPD